MGTRSKIPKLTGKQKRFVEEYLSNGFHGTNAAIAAGYSKKTAYSIANENLKKPEIKLHMENKEKSLAEKYGCDQEFVYKRLKDCASLDENENGSTVLKATELIAKHLGMFTEKSEVTLKTHEQWLDELGD